MNNSKTLSAVAAVALCLAVAGCKMVAGTHYALTGPPDVKAQYVPAKVPMVVVVENYRQTDPYGTDADLLASMITAELEARDVAPMIDPSRIEALKLEKGAGYQGMRIGDIGQALGAEQVLYVDLAGAQVAVQPGGVIDAKASVRVKIVNAADGRTLWPSNSISGHAINRTLPPARIKAGVDVASVRDELMTAVAVDVGRLYYSWKPKDMYEYENR